MINPYILARPVLFAMDAEQAHERVLRSMDLMSKTGLLKMAAGPKVSDPFELLGLQFPNRVGLAAGLDKNAAHIDALADLGFGFIEVGTVTPKAQPGNEKPRMFRLPEHNALINRLGFNNLGVDSFLKNVRQCKVLKQSGSRPIIGLNIGKNAATPISDATNDYLIALREVYPYADYVTVNISSPNTKNLRALQGGDELLGLLQALKTEQNHLRHNTKRSVPMLLKIAPDLDDDQVSFIAQTLTSQQFDGVIASNTTLSRDAVHGHQHAAQAGGLSGAPVLQMSNLLISKLRAALPPRFPIIGVGGVLSGADARSKILAGADLVQIYTGLIYKGPQLVCEAASAVKTLR
jgi:dihydroorotate dehydrogenase